MMRVFLLVLAAMLSCGGVFAKGDKPDGHQLVQDEVRSGTKVEFDEDQSEVYEAVKLGLVKPFSALYQAVDQQLHGRIIKVELEEDDELWIYELKLIHEEQVFNVEYDAASLAILEIEGRDLLKVIKR